VAIKGEHDKVAKRKIFTEHIITNAELNRFKRNKTKETRLEKLFGKDKDIELVRVYSNPLFPIQLLGKGPLHHAFVLFKLLDSNNTWWSIEQSTKSITMQTSKNGREIIATNGNDVQLAQKTQHER
jgi:hypothetical protein